MKETVSSNTVYTISAKDGRVLEVAGLAQHAGAAVQLWENAGSASQQWLASEVKPGVYKLENRLSGKVLDVAQAGTANGSPVHQWDYLGKDNQLWAVQPVKGGFVKLKSMLSGKVLDIAGIAAEHFAVQLCDHCLTNG